MSSFVQKKWADICTLEYGKGIRDYKNEDNDYSVYGSAGRVGTHSEFHLDKGVIVSRKGTLDVHYSDKPFFVIDTAFFLKPKPELNAKWAYYALKNFDIKKLTSGSGVPSLSRDEFYAEDLFLPSLEYQNEVESILSNIDKKIELNQKMNETLEEIAKTLFKSCFIDFDPVRAKAEGRPTGLSKEISDLFPDSFEESELGEIPKGWGLIKVEDVAKVTSGKAPPQREISKSDSSPFTIFGGAGPIGFCSKPLEFNKPAIITGRVGTLGKVFFINEECWISDNSILICDAGLYTSIIFSILNLMDMSALNVGSTQPLVTGKDIKNINLNKPPKIVLEKFTSFFDLIKSKQSTLEREVYCLIKLRDTLLPKLISGELKITDAESLVEEVGI